MSSVVRPSQQQQVQSTETTTKKKFGKNLNKLTKPPEAPPVATGVKPNASSRNGLLLLSTKRASSGNNAVSTSGGILSSKPTQTASNPRPSLGLQYESNTSTHDALLGAVVGASRAHEAEKQPDAWGVAEKQQKGFGGEVDLRSPESNVAAPDAQSPRTPGPQNSVNHGPERHDIDNNHSELPTSNWDEYGGRNLLNDKQENDVDQRAIMSRRARERAEERRAEEEARQNEQRERAAQRLRELEQKMVTDSPSEEVNSQPKAKFALEALGRSQSMPEEHTTRHPVSPSADRSSQRTLYDPNRTYSSLVGGGKDDRDSRPGSQDSSNHLRNGRIAAGSYSPEHQSLNDSRDPKFGRQPVIHLSSYEDRDRGERGSSAGPRMLYDPKSGSMVAVPSREDAAANARGRKERGKKGRNSRDKDSKADSKLDNSANDGSKSTRKGKQRRDDNVGKKGSDLGSTAKVDSKKGKLANERKLPRTCGVLYARDGKGNFYCADGCEGDLGYGAHSVPGGRTKNPEDYANFVESQKHIHQEDINMFDNHHMEASYEEDALNQDSAPAVTLHTGFSVPEPKELKLDWVKPNEKIELRTGIDDSPTLQATAREWAPSQAALAAAAAAAAAEKPILSTSVDSDGLEDDDDDDAPFGLGFDPTLNMDSVMQSPSADPVSGLDTVDLTALSLEPAFQGTAKSSHNIFAFESGATWGSSNTSGNNDWGMPSASPFASDDPNKALLPATFLSLSSNAWGGVPGLGGTSLGSSTLNGDRHTRSTGD